MRLARIAGLSTLMCCLAMGGVSQERYGKAESDGELERFVKNSVIGAYGIVRAEKPYLVRSVQGLVVFADEPKANVVFELKSADAAGKVREARTDHLGRFRIRHVSPGQYLFKATAEGFASVIGKVVVSPKALPEAQIRITLPLGV
jgi:carboxypeptidase family protein